MYITDKFANYIYGVIFLNSRRLKEYIIISFGSFLLAFAVTVFFVPQKITSGGISTIGTVLYYILGIPLSVTNLVLNAILFVFGFRLLGKRALYLTVLGVLSLTLYFELCSYFPAFTEDMFLSVVIGGVILGLGIGLVIRYGGSTGGTDLLSIMLHKKFPHISPANIILFIDCIIIAGSGLVFRSLTISLYSVLSLYISSKVCDAVISFGKSAKVLNIISPDNRLIAEKIMSVHERGVTGIRCCGMYKNRDLLMLYCAVNPREVPRVLETVRNIDQGAFVVITDVKEVYGEGFYRGM